MAVFIGDFVENKVKHLEMIQGIISRMAGNSFLLKGWAVTLTAALLALYTRNINQSIMWLLPAPLIIFWSLDAYYLSQEKCYRDLYNEVRLKKNNEIDFSMKHNHLQNDKNGWLIAFLSPTLFLFYGASLGIIVLYLHIMKGF